MRSLATRLNLGLSLSLAVLIGAAWWLGHAALHRSAEVYVVSHLEHAAEALVSGLSADPAEPGAALQAVLAPVYRQPFSGHYFEVLGPDGRRYSSRSLWDQRLPVAPLPVGRTEQRDARGPLDQLLLLRSTGYRIGDRVFTVAVAEDLDPLMTALQPFEQLFAVLAVTGFLLMLLIQHLTVRWTFRQLRPVYRDIEALERGASQQLTEAVPVEIRPLVRKLNALLSVYGRRLERSRNAAGNLAHALKGPLSLLLQELSRDDEPIDHERRRICHDQVRWVMALLERELKRARIAGGGGAGSLFDPREELPVLLDLLARSYADKGLQFELEDQLQTTVALDREDMLELIGTLLDNACKWAATRVLCRLEPLAGAGSPPGMRLCVEDDGPGCDDAELAAIGERGVRLDEAVAGHGLGLAIAREIVAEYDGRLALGRSQRVGGFRASVELPVAVG